MDTPMKLRAMLLLVVCSSIFLQLRRRSPKRLTMQAALRSENWDFALFAGGGSG